MAKTDKVDNALELKNGLKLLQKNRNEWFASPNEENFQKMYKAIEGLASVALPNATPEELAERRKILLNDVRDQLMPKLKAIRLKEGAIGDAGLKMINRIDKAQRVELKKASRAEVINQAAEANVALPHVAKADTGLAASPIAAPSPAPPVAVAASAAPMSPSASSPASQTPAPAPDSPINPGPSTPVLPAAPPWDAKDSTAVAASSPESQTPTSPVAASLAVESPQASSPLPADILITEINNDCSVERVRELIAANADLNARDSRGNTPLHLAINSPYGFDIAKVLIEAKADLNTPNKHGQSPMHMAVLSGNIEAVEALLQKKADPDVKAGDNGMTPLHLAANGAGVDMINVFLQNGVDPNVQNKFGLTPLHLAARAQDAEALKALAAAGADLAAKDSTGKSFADYIKDSPKKADLITELEQIEAKRKELGAEGRGVRPMPVADAALPSSPPPLQKLAPTPDAPKPFASSIAAFRTPEVQQGQPQQAPAAASPASSGSVASAYMPVDDDDHSAVLASPSSFASSLMSSPLRSTASLSSAGASPLNPAAASSSANLHPQQPVDRPPFVSSIAQLPQSPAVSSSSVQPPSWSSISSASSQPSRSATAQPEAPIQPPPLAAGQPQPNAQPQNLPPVQAQKVAAKGAIVLPHKSMTAKEIQDYHKAILDLAAQPDKTNEIKGLISIVAVNNPGSGVHEEAVGIALKNKALGNADLLITKGAKIQPDDLAQLCAPDNMKALGSKAKEKVCGAIADLLLQQSVKPGDDLSVVNAAHVKKASTPQVKFENGEFKVEINGKVNTIDQKVVEALVKQAQSSPAPKVAQAAAAPAAPAPNQQAVNAKPVQQRQYALFATTTPGVFVQLPVVTPDQYRQNLNAQMDQFLASEKQRFFDIQKQKNPLLKNFESIPQKDREQFEVYEKGQIARKENLLQQNFLQEELATTPPGERNQFLQQKLVELQQIQQERDKEYNASVERAQKGQPPYDNKAKEAMDKLQYKQNPLIFEGHIDTVKVVGKQAQLDDKLRTEIEAMAGKGAQVVAKEGSVNAQVVFGNQQDAKAFLDKMAAVHDLKGRNQEDKRFYPQHNNPGKFVVYVTPGEVQKLQQSMNGGNSVALGTGKAAELAKAAAQAVAPAPAPVQAPAPVAPQAPAAVLPPAPAAVPKVAEPAPVVPVVKGAEPAQAPAAVPKVAEPAQAPAAVLPPAPAAVAKVAQPAPESSVQAPPPEQPKPWYRQFIEAARNGFGLFGKPNESPSASAVGSPGAKGPTTSMSASYPPKVMAMGNQMMQTFTPPGTPVKNNESALSPSSTPGKGGGKVKGQAAGV